MTSRNQPHCLHSPHLISPPNQTHDIIPHHPTTTTHLPGKHNQPPPKHHHTQPLQAGAHKNSVWAALWLVALRTLYRQIFFLVDWVFPPARPGPTGSTHVFWNCIFYMQLCKPIIFEDFFRRENSDTAEGTLFYTYSKTNKFVDQERGYHGPKVQGPTFRTHFVSKHAVAIFETSRCLC